MLKGLVKGRLRVMPIAESKSLVNSGKTGELSPCLALTEARWGTSSIDILPQRAVPMYSMGPRIVAPCINSVNCSRVTCSVGSVSCGKFRIVAEYLLGGK